MTSPASDSVAEILDPPAAAAFLGITPELLFAYTLYPPKRARGESRRLPYVNTPNRSGFRKADLEGFDEYLKEKWSEHPKDRPDIPTYVVDYLKVESGGQCARCGKGFKLANAHIAPWAQTLSHHHHNLIRLCSGCHDEYDATNLIARAEMQSLKQRLIARVRSRLDTPLQAAGGVRVPNPSLCFLGRDHELAMLVELLQTRRTVSIEGPGGIGKTQLLIHALQRLPVERRVLWIDIQAFKRIGDIELAVEAGLAACGISVQGKPLRDALVDAELTLVFDGVEDLAVAAGDELVDFFQSLVVHTTRPRIVFTSQIELHGVDVAEKFTVPPLDREPGLALLQWDQTEATNGNGDDDVYWLANFCDGHPLALTLVRGLLNYFKSTATVKRRVSEHGAAALAAPTRQRHNPSTSLRACLLVSYETLTQEQRNCLFLVSHSPAGCVDRHLVRDKEYPLETVEEDVAALLRWHLIDAEEWGGLARLHILSAIRAFVLSEWESAPSSVKEKLRLHLAHAYTIQAMVIYDHHMQKADARFGVFRFDQEFPNFLYTFRHAVKASATNEDYLQHIGLMANSLMVYCFVRGLFGVGVSMMRAGAEAAERLGRVNSAATLLVQAVSLAKRARNQDAIRAAVAELNRICTGDVEPAVKGDAAIGRGDLALEEWRLNDAEKEFAAAELSYRAALENIKDDVASERGKDLVRMLAMALKMQGFVNEKRKNTAAAIGCYERAAGLLVEQDDSINVAATLHQLGNCHADLGQHERSFRCYLEAAHRFLAMPATEYLSNSLSEAGYVVIDWDGAAPGLPEISEDLLGTGLEDVFEQLATEVSTSLDVPFEVHGELLRKVFGMIALASFSEHNGLLEPWAAEIRETIVRPSIGDAKKPVTANPIFWMHLDLMTAVAGSISGSPQVKDGGPIGTLGEIQHLGILCYKFYDWGWTSFRVFDWLAAYLKRQRGIAKADKDRLRTSSQATAEDGVPFVLD